MEAIGEVLSSRITSYTAESWTLEETHPDMPTPCFGSFLKSFSEERRLTVYGIVFDIVAGPPDEHHRPAALRMTRAELKKEQPQIFSLIKTEWHVAVVAYKQGGRCHCGLPPFPPEVHDFVYPLENEEVLEASENIEFLRMLGSVTGVPQDELLSAAIRTAAKARQDDYKYLVEAGRQVSKLLRDDYDRLGFVLRKIRP